MLGHHTPVVGHETTENLYLSDRCPVKEASRRLSSGGVEPRLLMAVASVTMFFGG